MLKSRFSFFLAVFAVLFSVNTSIKADELTASNPINVAKNMMEAGDADRAKAILAKYTSDPDLQNDADFLLGMIAMNESELELSIKHFRKLLSRDPSLIRVRLELGRALYMRGDYSGAIYHFNFALASELPDPVIENIKRYLAAMNVEKQWNFDFGISLAPDDNINSATSAQTVDIYGMPMTLSEDAKKTSGIGLKTIGGASYQMPITEKVQLRAGIRGISKDYAGRDFDDVVASGYVGPKLVLGTVDFSLLTTTNRRWFAHQPYSDSLGLTFESNWRVSNRWRLGGSVSRSYIKYTKPKKYLDGLVDSFSGTVTYGINQSSFVQGIVGGSRERHRLDVHQNKSWTGGVGYYTDLPMGFSLYVSPTITQKKYDGELSAFGGSRTDRRLTGTVSLSNRKIDLWGFTPVLKFTHIRNDSTLDFYTYRKNAVEIGITSKF